MCAAWLLKTICRVLKKHFVVICEALGETANPERRLLDCFALRAVV